tara:strand:- start:1908 stop:2555 length:648 start_codon:yes stop_codon:yes gene_type:complete
MPIHIYAIAKSLLLVVYLILANIFIVYINHIISYKITKQSIIQNRQPLSDIIHSYVDEINEYYLNTTLLLQVLLFLFYCFVYCKHKLILFLKGNCFVILMFTLRMFTIISTQYPNARGCNSIYQYCGDMMFSGHSVFVLTQYLSMNTYLKIENENYIKSDKYFLKLIDRIHLLLVFINLFLIVAARLHYTNDVLVSSYLSIVTWKYIDLYLKNKE